MKSITAWGIVLVALGGAIGAASRFVLANLVQRLDPDGTFPFGTLVVNALGCFVIGLIAGMITVRDEPSNEMRLFVMIGVLGAFTTFSTFGLETLSLARDGALLRAGLNVAASVVVCLGAVWGGFVLGGLK